MPYEKLISGEITGRTFQQGKRLGKGAWGSVYQARENTTRYAIKLPHLEEDEIIEENLIKEAAIQREVSHPNITPVVLFDYHREALFSQRGTPFMVTPLARTDLWNLVDDQISPERAYALSEGVAHAVATLHDQGIVHADIKPKNILIYKHRRMGIAGKLADFGGAVHVNENGAIREGEWFHMTHTYAAPEAIQSLSPTPAHDQYGWGLGVAYTAFTGIRLFGDEANSDTIHIEHPSFNLIQGKEKPLPSFELLIPQEMTHLHEAIEPVIRRAMQIDPQARYPTMDELLDDLRYRRRREEEKQKRQTRHL